MVTREQTARVCVFVYVIVYQQTRAKVQWEVLLNGEHIYEKSR